MKIDDIFSQIRKEERSHLSVGIVSPQGAELALNFIFSQIGGRVLMLADKPTRWEVLARMNGFPLIHGGDGLGEMDLELLGSFMCNRFRHMVVSPQEFADMPCISTVDCLIIAADLPVCKMIEWVDKITRLRAYNPGHEAHLVFLIKSNPPLNPLLNENRETIKEDWLTA